MIAVVLVAAVADNGVIGRDNGMPWRLKSDMQRFRALTWGRPVVMGRRTFLSIGKPLAGRTNIVASRDRTFSAPGIAVARSVEAALAVACADALRRGVDEIMVIGGGQIYAALMPQASRLELTRVHAQPAGDSVFPAIDPGAWRQISREDHPAGPHDSAAYSFQTFERMRHE